MSLIDGRLIRVTYGPLCYAIVVHDGRVVEAAPVARWMVGRDERWVADWLRRRGAQIEPLD